MTFQGIITALVTPFRNGAVDFEALERLVERQIAGGVDGLVACGCTGEAATLSMEEDRAVWRAVKEIARGRTAVIAGAGSNCTADTVKHAREAQADGVDAVMLITPYYNKPTQEGLYLHFKSIADALTLPVMLYNVPGRTATNIEPETIARLSQIKNIVALKEASGTVAGTTWAIKLARPGFTVLSGDDPLFLSVAALGARGVVSVASNVVPDRMARMWSLFEKDDLAGAAAIHYELMPLFKVLFIESNPIPVKSALSMMGLIAEEYRLPLCPPSDANRRKVRDVLAEMGLLPN